MQTQCTQQTFEFEALGRREVVARFDGGPITSDAGGLFLREVDEQTGILGRLARCFTDYRDEDLIEHSVEELLRQRIIGLALGYEDLNDHDQLRYDPLLATLVGKQDPTGEARPRKRDRGKALAGKSTLNRLELTPRGASEGNRYKKIAADGGEIEAMFVDVFLQLHPKPLKRIVLDLDATDDPIHGDQLGKFFHGYYKSYCYLPLYIFCGDHLLCAKLRPADIDGAAGSVKQLDRIVKQIRTKWPEIQIVIRGDSGFCRERIMAWCEVNAVDYILGLAKNKRLERILGEELQEAKQQFEATGKASRVFKDFTYQTRKSWSRVRRVVGKAEHLRKGANPRFVVSSIPSEDIPARELYEDEYCARGEMENRIKEQQLCLFADRTSANTMRANQLRLWFSSVAYTLLQVLRQFGLQGTKFARARCDTIRLKLLKIGASVRVTVRRVWLSMSESCPYQELFATVYANLRRWLGQLTPG